VTGRRRRPEDETTPSLWSRRLAIGLPLVLGPELVANLVSSMVTSSPFGSSLNQHWVLVLLVAGLLVAAVLVALWVLDRRRVARVRPQPPAPAIVPRFVPEPQRLPAWHRFPSRIHGRDDDIERALRVVRSRGVVAVVGRRDIGTSSVANRVVARLLAEDVGGGADAVVWVDLRGNSSTSPPGARAIAGRLLSTFDLDEPADATPPVLADAAARLVAAARQRTTVLLLDNVFTADQVSWLTEVWPLAGQPPMLVIAGDEPAAAAVGPTSVVTVGELKLSAMRDILSDELGESRLRRFARGVRRDLRVDRNDPVEELLSRFRGLPRAVREIARLLRVAGERSWSVVELIEDTADPLRGNEPLVALWRAVLPLLMRRRDLSERAIDLMRALAVLPVTGLSRESLDALLTDDEHAPGDEDPVGELSKANLVRESPPGRFRLPEEVRRALRQVEPWPVPERVWRAVAALLRHYAVQAGRWATALRSVTDSRSAIVWLHQEEPLLRALLTDWRPDALPPESVVDDLAAIADALDVWYIRELQSDGLVTTSRGLAELADRAGRDELVELAQLRTAAAHRIGTHLDLADIAIAAGEPDERTARHPAGFALRARWHNERALIEFDRAALVRSDPPAFTERLQAAENELRRALALVPENDPAGRLCVLVNLAAVCLEQRRLFAALEFLDQAEVVAGASGDLSGAAQVVELQGVQAIFGGNAPHAVARWQQALALYRDLGEEQGQARCLQHLGTLAVVSPDIAGVLDTGHRFPVGADRAAAVAHDHLVRGRRLLAGQPDTTLVDYYLRIAEQRMSGPQPQ
jgi:tetratricopeptide (TPR) repeat protein